MRQLLCCNWNFDARHFKEFYRYASFIELHLDNFVGE